MKGFLIIVLLALIVAALAGAGCRKHVNLAVNETIIGLQKCAQINPSASICLDSLIQDSRCPKDVVCFWSGTAIVKVTFRESGNQHQFRMSLIGYPHLGYPSDTAIGAYRISFQGLEPYPTISHPWPIIKKTKAMFVISQ